MLGTDRIFAFGRKLLQGTAGLWYLLPAVVSFLAGRECKAASGADLVRRKLETAQLGHAGGLRTCF